MESFQITSSFTRRLRSVLIIIAAFFLIGVVSSYFSSLDFLNGLQSLNTANKILNLSTLSIESLDSAEETLEKLRLGGHSRNGQFSFEQSLKLTNQQLDDAISFAEKFPDARKLFRDAKTALHEFEQSSQKLFLMKNRSSEFRQEFLVAKEFVSDARETLRMGQIVLKNQSDELFLSIYDTRFLPLIVVSVLSIFFFSFVIVVGLSTARRLSRALSNLKTATGAVAKGDLSFQAPILEKDEFGKLTHQFNHMVRSLDNNEREIKWVLDRVSRLQKITVAFSEALSQEKVFEVMFKVAFETIGIKSGIVGLVNKEDELIHVQRGEGYAEDFTDTTFDLNLNVPLAESIRTGQKIYLRDLEMTKRSYPIAYEFQAKNGIKSSCALPLIVEGKIIGSIVLSFSIEKEFPRDEIEFIEALINQCSQALHRAFLFEAAQEAIKVRDEFLSIASHELRTPLTPLKLQLQSLGRHLKASDVLESDARVLKMVESSDRQVNRLTSLIDDLLDVSRISAGKLNLNKEKIQLAELMEEVISNYKHQLQEKKIHLEVSLDRDLHGDYDRVRIEQVFINLLTNAAKYAPGKPLKIKLERSGDSATISVEDQGAGISPADQRRIFERFERVKDRDNVGGLGLGLYISRQIVEAHGGTISVESKPGVGSRFWVTLPLS